MKIQNVSFIAFSDLGLTEKQSANKIVCEAGDEGVVENIDDATDILNDECEAV